ncbi:hypothetical protein SARC_05890 [Sphaeroforma arctica JP610]|uniref:Right handed beta helix domain-containing protein n=1 Tax=Sphaeroforma arctica JP610 TaxID=667725 RepID=A0A0L0FY90_9EUKA|nr:hypothetical protein SARC_05890 [Sphaeroforma arctica JP610]KNC81805.1 hypothetical protein SARC_05890 [Sphaeroforma arctica JP610]|eukprot:XP_014155707.1 hypothetical protein SARC_05890 [Sphaeroforma arctica JP610]
MPIFCIATAVLLVCSGATAREVGPEQRQVTLPHSEAPDITYGNDWPEFAEAINQLVYANAVGNPALELDYGPQDKWLAKNQYRDHYTDAVRTRAVRALEIPHKLLGEEIVTQSDGEQLWLPIYELPGSEGNVTLKPGQYILENGTVLSDGTSLADYYRENGEMGSQGSDESLLEGRLWINEERTIWNDALLTTGGRSCGCVGEQVWLKVSCVVDLETAITNSAAGDVIFISGKKSITNPVYFSHDLAIIGEECGTLGKPRILMNFDSRYKAGLMLNNRETQTLHVNNVDFLAGRAANGVDGQHFNSAIQAQDFYAWISLQLKNTSFQNFFSRHRGSAIFVWTTGNVTIDDDCRFVNNMVGDRREVFGGGAFSMGYVSANSHVYIGGLWDRNAVVYPFPFGSEHGEGGALFADWIDGHVYINGTFHDNLAADGGAIHFKMVANGSLVLDGEYSGNLALDTGAGGRGAVIRIVELKSDLELRGNFSNNIADTGRGGVVAVNNMPKWSKIFLSGTFHNNRCGDRGGVVSCTKIFEGRLDLVKGAFFDGNEARDDDRTDIYHILNPQAQRLDEGKLASNPVKETVKVFPKTPTKRRSVMVQAPLGQSRISA